MPPSKPSSLIRRIALLHAAIGLLAVLVGAVAFHQTIAIIVWEQHRRSILASAEEVLQRLQREGVAGLARPLPPGVARRFDAAQGSMRFAVLGREGEVLAASPGALGVLPRRREDGSLPADFREGSDGSSLWGITRAVPTPQGRLEVQIAQDMDRQYVVLDDVAPAALGPLLLVLALGALMLFAANTALVVLSLRPLRKAAREAALIGQDGPARLEEAGVPVEVAPLLRAVNAGLDRLDEALAWQRGFSEEVAHELRTPLAVMQAELDLLDPSPARERLRQDVQELARLVDDLLELAETRGAPQSGQEVFDLAALALGSGRRLASIAAQRDQRLDLPEAAAPIPVRGNREAVGRALRNLIENALSHSPPGATITVSLRAGPEAAVAIADRGPGVAPEDRALIFRRNWRKPGAQKRGLGLGLSIAEAIARAHGGGIEIADNPGGGAVFTIRLRAEPGALPPA
ncbi:sensor histidine kinase [Roseococcus microcysteis]|uniref:sensor histidine kinase n=1 Tax=Roseococcus microcysteis TaxID=2771361 RepID=UPI00168BBECA|nr:HAMP domain-containing sensor histidine kinase [Roseococcus microcysteis]